MRSKTNRRIKTFRKNRKNKRRSVKKGGGWVKAGITWKKGISANDYETLDNIHASSPKKCENRVAKFNARKFIYKQHTNEEATFYFFYDFEYAEKLNTLHSAQEFITRSLTSIPRTAIKVSEDNSHDRSWRRSIFSRFMSNAASFLGFNNVFSSYVKIDNKVIDARSIKNEQFDKYNGFYMIKMKKRPESYYRRMQLNNSYTLQEITTSDYTLLQKQKTTQGHEYNSSAWSELTDYIFMFEKISKVLEKYKSFESTHTINITQEKNAEKNERVDNGRYLSKEIREYTYSPTGEAEIARTNTDKWLSDFTNELSSYPGQFTNAWTDKGVTAWSGTDLMVPIAEILKHLTNFFLNT